MVAKRALGCCILFYRDMVCWNWQNQSFRFNYCEYRYGRTMPNRKQICDDNANNNQTTNSKPKANNANNNGIRHLNLTSYFLLPRTAHKRMPDTCGGAEISFGWLARLVTHSFFHSFIYTKFAIFISRQYLCMYVCVRLGGIWTDAD